MKTAEAKRWLTAHATFREMPHYSQGDDDIYMMYAPRLCGKDVCLEGRPKMFRTSAQAVTEAKRFQAAIRKNHPEITV